MAQAKRGKCVIALKQQNFEFFFRNIDNFSSSIN